MPVLGEAPGFAEGPKRRLREAGHKQSEIAKQIGVSERSVRTIESEPAVATIDDAGERRRRRIGRPSKAEPFGDIVVATLKEEPELMSLELLRRARLKGYAGGKSAFYELVALLRTPVARPVVRFEGLPGEFTQHDFGHVDVRYVSGACRRVHFFASRLKYLRHVEVTLVANEQTETIVRTLVVHFDRLFRSRSADSARALPVSQDGRRLRLDAAVDAPSFPPWLVSLARLRHRWPWADPLR